MPKQPAQFKLAGALTIKKADGSATDQGSASKPTFSFKPQARKSDEQSKPAADVKPGETKNLFGNGEKKFAVATSGTFGGVKVSEISKKEGQASGPLFGANAGKEPLFKPTTSNVFGGVKLPDTAAPKKEEKKAEAPASIFGAASGATAQSGGGSLFGNLNTI